MNTIRDLRLVLTRDDLRAIAVLVAIFVIMAGLEVFGVGSIYWFISLITDPSKSQSSDKLMWLKDTVGLQSDDAVIVALGAILVVSFLARNTFAVFNVFAQERFLRREYVLLATRLVRVYLNKPYQFFLQTNSSELNKNVLVEVWRLASGVLMPVVDMLAKLITAIALVGFLFWQNFATTLAILVVLAIFCVVLYLPLRGRLRLVGRMLMDAETDRFKSLNELFGSVKDVRVLGREKFFLDRFVAAAEHYGRCNLSLRVLTNVPHYALEVIAVTTIVAVILVIRSTSINPGDAVAAAAMYAAAGYRLLPVIKTIMQTVTEMRVGQPLLDALREELIAGKTDRLSQPADRPRFRFERAIELRNLSFQYEKSDGSGLKAVNISVPKKSAVALVGPTGAGKTTLVDLVLGLLPPRQGHILVDGVAISADNVRSWQDELGYVPQHIYLTDDSVRRNIAFGIPDAEIDDAEVRRAARAASIDTFIEQNLPQGYNTLVGERGVRLSGGERQRIGIARALYHRPSVLVLDEATSALDGRTEAVIGDAIATLSHEITLIVIAHRLSTVKNCDVIYLLEEGRIVDSGSYDELMARNDIFRAMARA